MGIDLNIFLKLLKKYKYAYFTNKTSSFYASDTFTINNNLDYFYQTVRKNYVNDNYKFIFAFFIKFLITIKILKIF